MQLIPNLLGMWVYADDKCPRYDPPAMLQYGGRYYINTADVDAFHRWAFAKAPREFQYQDRIPWEPYPNKASKLRDALIRMAEELDDPLRMGRPPSLVGDR